MQQVYTGLSNNTTYKNIRFASKDITEDITRPSFYCNCKNTPSLANYRTKNTNVKVEIYYFAKNTDTIATELQEMEELLSNIFLQYVKIQDSYISILNGLEFDVRKKDAMLICEFEFDVIQDISEELLKDTPLDRTDENKEKIENLEIYIN